MSDLNLDLNDPGDGFVDISSKDVSFLKAADETKELPFGGKLGGPTKIEPFNTHRQIAAQKLGMEFFNMGEEAISEFQDRGTYNGIFLDAVLVVFLCISPLSVSKRALRVSSSVREEAMNWANQNGIRFGNANHGHLVEAFGDIVQEIVESAAEIDQSNPAEPGESLGEQSGASAKTSA